MTNKVNSEDIEKQDEHSEETFTKCDTFWYIFTPIWLIFDVTNDFNLAFRYYKEEHYWLFTVTFVCPVIAILSMNLCSFLTRINDDVMVERQLENNPRKKRKISFVALLVFIFQLEVFKRYFELVIIGRRSNNQVTGKSLKHRVSDAIVTVTMMKVIQCFIEAIPLLILQLYVIACKESEFLGREERLKFYPNFTDILELGIMYQIINIALSFIFIAWTVMAYSQNAHRFLEDLEQRLSWIHRMFYYFWHLGTIAARILVLSLFASSFPGWIWGVLVFRWIIMTSWLMYQTVDVFHSNCCNKLLTVAIGFMHMFCFINIRERPTPMKYFVYYSYDFVENTLLLILWCSQINPYIWYFYPATVCVIGSFFIGLTFLLHFHYNVLQTIKETEQTRKSRETFEVDGDGQKVPRWKDQTTLGRRKTPHLIL